VAANRQLCQSHERYQPTPAFTGPQRTRPSAPLQLPCGLFLNIPILTLYMDLIGGLGVAS